MGIHSRRRTRMKKKYYDDENEDNDNIYQGWVGGGGSWTEN